MDGSQSAGSADLTECHAATARSETQPDLLPRAKAILDAGHAGHGPAKQRLLDYIAVRLLNADAPSPVLCLLGPGGVGKSSLARLVAAALGRAFAWVLCGGLSGASALHGSRSGLPGRIVDELPASASAIRSSFSMRSTACPSRVVPRRRCSR